MTYTKQTVEECLRGTGLFTKKEKCLSCDGEGGGYVSLRMGSWECTICQGTGKVSAEFRMPTDNEACKILIGVGCQVWYDNDKSKWFLEREDGVDISLEGIEKGNIELALPAALCEAHKLGLLSEGVL